MKLLWSLELTMCSIKFIVPLFIIVNTVGLGPEQGSAVAEPGIFLAEIIPYRSKRQWGTTLNACVKWL